MLHSGVVEAASAVKPPSLHNYDTSQARRQAKRRAQFMQMRTALRDIAEARTLSEAKALARRGLDDPKNPTMTLEVHR